jgi:DNA-binding transcriptional LysR family regulator
MDLNAVALFARVVEAGSFSGAARALKLPKSTVSRKLTTLENELGVRLVQRTTRKMGLTDAGRRFYEASARVVAAAQDGLQAVSSVASSPRGLLRVTAPLSFAMLGPDIAAFLLKHTEVQIELVCTDRQVDLVEENFDVAIRAGALADSTLVARPLGRLQRVLVAAPSYCEAHGTPRTAQDLTKHACISFGSGVSPNVWTLYAEGRHASPRGHRARERTEKTVEVHVVPRLVVNDFEMMAAAARAGVGIAWMMASICADDLAAGRLRRVLPTYGSRETPVHAVYPTARHVSPKVTAFIEHVRRAFAGDSTANDR